MKKLLLSCAVAVVAAVSFTSCDKAETCYTCKKTASTVTTTSEICDGKITTTVGSAASTSANLGSGVTADQQKAAFEKIGYTCTAK